MTNGLVRVTRLFALGAASLSLALACSTQQPQVQVPAPQNGPTGPGGSDGGAGNGSAQIQLQFPSGAVAQYLTPNGLVHFKITLGSELPDEGDFKMVNGKGEIKSRSWRVGATGNLEVDLSQGGQLKLHGEAKNVTLKAGNNPITLQVTDASGNTVGTSTGGGTTTTTNTSTSTSTSGGNTADLDISIDATGGTGTLGGSTSNLGTSSGTTSSTTGPNLVQYSDIAPLSQKYCSGSCHATGKTAPDLSSEQGWKTSCKTIASDLQINKMPLGSATPPTADEKAKLQAYCNAQP
jgi:hypothetical protein